MEVTTKIATVPSTITRELHRAKPGRQRRASVRRLVVELGARMWAPGGVPAWVDVAVTVAIPAGLEKASEVIDPQGWYEVEVADGFIELDGSDLIALADALVRLADAQTAGDEPAARRALRSLLER